MSVLVSDIAGLLDSTVSTGPRWSVTTGEPCWLAARGQPAAAGGPLGGGLGGSSRGGVTSGAADPQQRSGYLRWFLPPGVAERMLPRDDWRLFRDWGWHGAEPNTDPDCDRQIADLSRPGALTAGLNWYRANLGSAAAADQRTSGQWCRSRARRWGCGPAGTSSWPRRR